MPCFYYDYFLGLLARGSSEERMAECHKEIANVGCGNWSNVVTDKKPQAATEVSSLAVLLPSPLTPCCRPSG